MLRKDKRVEAQEGGELEPHCGSGPREGEEWAVRRLRAIAQFRGQSYCKPDLTSDTSCKLRVSKITLMLP